MFDSPFAIITCICFSHEVLLHCLCFVWQLCLHSRYTVVFSPLDWYLYVYNELPKQHERNGAAEKFNVSDL